MLAPVQSAAQIDALASRRRECHCFTCHRYLGEHPIEFAEWIEKHLGGVRTSLLRHLSQKIAKFNKRDLAEIEADLKVELQLMRGARAKGVVGRIEFAAPRAVQALEDGLKARAA